MCHDWDILCRLLRAYLQLSAIATKKWGRLQHKIRIQDPHSLQYQYLWTSWQQTNLQAGSPTVCEAAGSKRLFLRNPKKRKSLRKGMQRRSPLVLSKTFPFPGSTQTDTASQWCECRSPVCSVHSTPLCLGANCSDRPLTLEAVPLSRDKTH